MKCAVYIITLRHLPVDYVLSTESIPYDTNNSVFIEVVESSSSMGLEGRSLGLTRQLCFGEATPPNGVNSSLNS